MTRGLSTGERLTARTARPTPQNGVAAAADAQPKEVGTSLECPRGGWGEPSPNLAEAPELDHDDASKLMLPLESLGP